jgi:hypothetical protein
MLQTARLSVTALESPVKQQQQLLLHRANCAMRADAAAVGVAAVVALLDH